MANQADLDRCYMQVAEAHAALSKGVRLKVGSCMVTRTGTILAGTNGLPRPLGNTLEEYELPMYSADGTKLDAPLITKQEVIHSEENCILKAAKEGVSIEGATIYITHSPCRHCSSMLISCGIKRVVYGELYRDDSGIRNLQKAGIRVDSFEETQQVPYNDFWLIRG